MNLLPKTIGHCLGGALQRLARARTRGELLRRSDRALADAGLSRELLLVGTRAWPWRVDHAADDARDAALLATRRRAAAAPHAMDDRDPADLALVRADIPRAVIEGRPGTETERDDARIAA